MSTILLNLFTFCSSALRTLPSPCSRQTALSLLCSSLTANLRCVLQPGIKTQDSSLKARLVFVEEMGLGLGFRVTFKGKRQAASGLGTLVDRCRGIRVPSLDPICQGMLWALSVICSKDA